MPTVDIHDGGLSDHRLLRWSSRLCRPAPVYTTSVRRCWRSFDPGTFLDDLLMSALCDVQSYSDLDSDCRSAKRKVRRLETAARREGPLALSTSPNAAAWRAERRAYFNLLQRKQRTYWTERVDADQSHTCRLWRSFDELLGRDRPRPSDVDATE